jgi:hypothetical protein
MIKKIAPQSVNKVKKVLKLFRSTKLLGLDDIIIMFLKLQNQSVINIRTYARKKTQIRICLNDIENAAFKAALNKSATNEISLCILRATCTVVSPKYNKNLVAEWIIS